MGSALRPLAWIELVEEEDEPLPDSIIKISIWFQEASIELTSR